jgi:hypothetical protein
LYQGNIRIWPPKLAQLLTREVRTAPTLVKYAQPNEYEMQTRAELEQAAAEFSRHPHRRCAAGRPGRAHRDPSKSSWPRR